MKDFDEVLSTLQDGRLAADLDKKYAELVKQCRHTGKEGTLTLKLKLKPVGQKQMRHNPELTVKKPEFDRPDDLFFDDDKGHVHTSDPDQKDLPGIVRPDFGNGPVQKID